MIFQRVDICNQLDWTQNHHGSIITGVFVRVFPARFNKGRKTHSECEWHYSMVWGPGLIKKEKEN